jgi:peroxiredoxin
MNTHSQKVLITNLRGLSPLRPLGKLKILAILMAVSALLSFSLGKAALAQMKVGKKVPDFTTTTLDGKQFNLKEYLKQPGHKVLILTFFATWCEYCDEDLKYLQELEKQYGEQGLRVLCVFTGRLSKVKAAKKYLEGKDIHWPILLDKKKVISRRLRVTALPCNYAIDKEGVLRFRCLGCSEDVKRKFEENLKALLSTP